MSSASSDVLFLDQPTTPEDGGGITYIFMTDGQEIVMSILYVVSSALSLLGSSTIVYKILSDRAHATAYDRLMLGLSVSDIIASTAWLLTPFLLPADTSPRVWAIGNNGTCSMLGFLTQLGFSSIWYNGFLSFYFLATIRYGMDRRKFAIRCEPFIHIFTILFSLSTSVAGIGVGFFSELSVGMGCWVNDYPQGCIEDCAAETIAWMYGPVPAFFTIASLIFNNLTVYCHVRSVFNISEQAIDDSEDNPILLRQQIQKREVATQGFLYVAAFFFCYWPVATARGIEAWNTEEVNEQEIYWVLMFQAGALPVQGLLNMLIYNRPNLKRVHAAYPNLPWFTSWRVACFDRHIPKLAELSEPETRALAAASNSRRRRTTNGKSSREGGSSSQRSNKSDESIDSNKDDLSRNSLSRKSNLESIKETDYADLDASGHSEGPSNRDTFNPNKSTCSIDPTQVTTSNLGTSRQGGGDLSDRGAVPQLVGDGSQVGSAELTESVHTNTSSFSRSAGNLATSIDLATQGNGSSRDFLEASSFSSSSTKPRRIFERIKRIEFGESPPPSC